MIKIGVVGLGHWGPNHVRVFNSLSDSRVVAVADADDARTTRVLKTTPGLQTFSSASSLLAESDVDAVVICTPTSTHYHLVRDALMSGRHVLCEKPLCLSSAEGNTLVRVAAEHDRLLMVGHVFLFNPGIVKVKELLRSGELGKPHYLSAVRTNLGPIRRDVNAAWDLASHDVAIFNWLLESEPVAVRAMGAAFLQPGIEDVVNITLKYPGNILASIQCSWLDPKKVRQLTLVGSEKMVTWDDLNLSTPIAIYEKGAKTDLDVSDYGQFLRISMWEGDIRMPKLTQSEPLKAQAEYFLRAINDRSLESSNGAFATGVVRVLEQVKTALAAS